MPPHVRGSRAGHSDAAAHGKLGSGSRFAAVEKAAAADGARDPAAVAASIGMKKYGKAKMEQMAQEGRRKK
jgi:hypothetical protein